MTANNDTFTVQDDAREAVPLWRILLILTVILFCSWIMWSFQDQALYFFSASTPLDLGAAELIQKGPLAAPPGSFVTIEGFPEAHRVVKWEERLGGERKIFRLMGASPAIFVEVPASLIKQGEFPDLYQGRLVPFDSLPSGYDSVRQFYKENFHYDIPPGSSLIVAGDQPQDKWIYLVLYAILAGFVAFDVFMLVRMIRRKFAPST